MKILKENVTKSKDVSLLAVTSSGTSIHQKVCINWKHIQWMFDEAMCYQTQMPFILVILFSNTGQCYWPAQKIKNSDTLGQFRTKYGIISKYFRPLHKLV